MKKIAIFHNLKKGGALLLLTKLSYELKKRYIVDIFTYSSEKIDKTCYDHLRYYPIKKTKNVLECLVQLFELKRLNKQIAKEIDNNNYVRLIIFPCLITQSPLIIKFVKHTKNLYIFTESKREFYENTSFDHYSPKRLVARLVRLPIKIIDRINCQKAKNIISISYFSQHILAKIYSKKSLVVQPGIQEIKVKKYKLLNNKKFLSVGLLSRIKGHDFSLNQLKGQINILTVLGRKNEDAEKIINLARKNKIELRLISTESNPRKDNLYQKHTIYLANQNNEPFGLSTLEACQNKCYVIGKNSGGTPEIIKHGLNGFLYPESINLARKSVKLIKRKKYLTLNTTCNINWKSTTDKIIKIILEL